MAKTIGIIGTLDTKWPESSYVKKEIERRDCRALVIDAGVFTASSVVPEVSAEKVAAAGGQQLADLVARRDRGEAMQVMSHGAAVVVKELHEASMFDGLVALGGPAVERPSLQLPCGLCLTGLSRATVLVFRS
jgi:uncharacterized protein (UPF0261 family)